MVQCGGQSENTAVSLNLVVLLDGTVRWPVLNTAVSLNLDVLMVQCGAWTG